MNPVVRPGLDEWSGSCCSDGGGIRVSRAAYAVTWDEKNCEG